MDDAGPQSLFLVVSWITGAVPYSSSIIQLDTPQVDASSLAYTPVIPTEFSAHIPRLKQPRRPIGLQMASSSEDLYMFPDWTFQKSPEEKDGALPGFIFNLSSKKCKLIKPPMAPKYMGHAVMLGDHIYFMAEPCYSHNSPDPRFECYDTLSQKWEKREPLPLDTTYGDRLTGYIQGCAVLDDTILFYIDGSGGPNMQAYNVGRDKWYPVEVSNDLCYSLVGVAVVLNKFIYGLPLHRESVVALQLKSRKKKDGDLVFTCNLHKEYKVRGLSQVKFERWWDSDLWTKHLVHLGKDNFCVVQSGRCGGLESQYIQLTNIELREKESIVTSISVHEFKLPRHGVFIIRHCFSVPKCKTTTALKEQEAEIVTLPPELLPFLDKYSSQTNIIDEQGGSVNQSSQSRDDADTKSPQVQEDVPKKSSASVVTGNQSLNDATKASTLGNGHSICVTNLPPNANCGQFFRRLMEFGPFKNFDFRFDPDNPSGSYVDVEFVSATSKQNAIKASPIKIGGYLVVIEEKRGTGHNQVIQTSESGDDADTTPEVQVAAESNVPCKACTVTEHQSLNDATKASTLGDGGECGRSHTFEEGHSIWVTNLAPDAKFQRQFYERLKRFGLIKNFVCQVDPDNTNDLVAHVEFESATSKQKAVKASVIKIGGRKAVIEEKRGTCLTQVSQSSQSRDDADTKIPQVQEDVPKKSVVAAESNVPCKASTVTGHQSLNDATKASTPGDGHSIFVTNLPPNTHSRQLEKRLKRFGLIKSVAIKTYLNHMGECCFADVEFESAASKKNAIQESILEIGNRLAVIEEKIVTGLTQGDSDRSSTSPRNKLKKRGKDSRSRKTSREGLSRITPL